MIITCIMVYLRVFVELHETCYGVSEEACGIMFILLREIQRRGQRKKGKDGGNKHRKMKAGNKKGQWHLNRLLVGTLLRSNLRSARAILSSY